MDLNVSGDVAERCGGGILIGVAGAVRVGKTSFADGFLSAVSSGGYDADAGRARIDIPDGAADIGVREFSDLPELSCSAYIILKSDGTAGEADAASCSEAAERIAARLKGAGKPFIIVINSTDPSGGGAQTERRAAEENYGCAATALDCRRIGGDDCTEILRELLFEFPVVSIDVDIPEWTRYLPAESSAISELLERIRKAAPGIVRMRDCSALDEAFRDCTCWQDSVSVGLDMAAGRARVTVPVKEGIFFGMLSEIAGEGIDGESTLMRYVRSAAEAKRGYGKIKDAFECAQVNGYGIVSPDDGDMSLEQPSVVRSGSNVGIKLSAAAPTYHIIKVDINGEVSPIMGGAAQSESIVQGMMDGFESDPEGMWDTNLFGKSLREMVKEGLSGKMNVLRDDTKVKMRKALTRMVNEGKGGVICILL